jgi:hypothetical protein
MRDRFFDWSWHNVSLLQPLHKELKTTATNDVGTMTCLQNTCSTYKSRLRHLAHCGHTKLRALSVSGQVTAPSDQEFSITTLTLFSKNLLLIWIQLTQQPREGALG